MKFAFALAFALFALVLPTSAATAPEVASAPVQANISDSAPAPIPLIPQYLRQYCWDVEGTTCSPVGSTTGCTDVCFNQLSCTCRSYVWLGQTVRYWDCQEVC